MGLVSKNVDRSEMEQCSLLVLKACTVKKKLHFVQIVDKINAQSHEL